MRLGQSFCSARIIRVYAKHIGMSMWIFEQQKLSKHSALLRKCFGVLCTQCVGGVASEWHSAVHVISLA